MDATAFLKDLQHMKTTDLGELRAGYPFTWGKIIKMHAIGRYTLVEYEDQLGETLFHAYVDGESTSTSETSLERALIYAIGRGNLEINDARHMASAACKVLSLKEYGH